MMATLMFWNMEHNIEQLATLTYGIAPIPKFSKTQEYRSYVQDQVSSFGISAGVGGDDRSEELARAEELVVSLSSGAASVTWGDTQWVDLPPGDFLLRFVFLRQKNLQICASGDFWYLCFLQIRVTH